MPFTADVDLPLHRDPGRSHGRIKTSPDGHTGRCQDPDLFFRERKQVRILTCRHPDLFCVDPKLEPESRHFLQQVRMVTRADVKIRTCFAVNENKSRS
jgi:hypothetical protein